ncbi:MAG: VWA domain-containing protein [Nocardioidaceae bacterium]|nr:VWA domain-containing protein [Nocardioidaceae bacterium]MCL2612819.1 VWA domain-containing protein [Nocardioidaceae bacterium]
MRLPLLLARRIGIVVALVLVLLHPGFGHAKVPTQVSDIQVLFVVDRTRSMAAEDYGNHEPRIDGVRTDLKALADALPGARFGLMTFGFDSRMELPYTNDADAFDSEVDTLTLEQPTAGIGSAMDRPKEQMVQVLSDAEKQYPDRRQVLVFVSDGEDTTKTPQTSMSDVAKYVDGGVVLGYGTTQGGPMPEADDLTNDEGLIQDPSTGTTAISHADPANLQRIAQQMGIGYEHRSAPGGMDALARSFKASYVAAPASEGATAENDLTWVFGLVLLGLVLLELRAGWRAVWTTRRALR